MPVTSSVIAQIIREGMDDYWRVVCSPSDEGLTPIELGWKRDYERDIRRFDEKYGAELDRFFARK